MKKICALPVFTTRLCRVHDISNHASCSHKERNKIIKHDAKLIIETKSK